MENIYRLAKIINEAENIVAFTGAGVSTESNIPDFRSQKGLYSNDREEYPPEVMLSHSFFMSNTADFYRFYKGKMVYKDAKPNICHTFLAELEQEGKLKAVITQNIYNLHQAGGCKNVLELHGSVYRNYCVACNEFYDIEYILSYPDEIPRCKKCGDVVKPDVILYEETLDEEIISKSIQYINNADVLIIMGTSLVVYPAAAMIDYFRGKHLVLINRSKTPYDNRADLVIHNSLGDTMTNLMNIYTII